MSIIAHFRRYRHCGKSFPRGAIFSILKRFY